MRAQKTLQQRTMADESAQPGQVVPESNDEASEEEDASVPPAIPDDVEANAEASDDGTASDEETTSVEEYEDRIERGQRQGYAGVAIKIWEVSSHTSFVLGIAP